MSLYEVSLFMSLWGFGMGTMLVNFHVCGIMLLLRAVLNVLVRKASPIGYICVRCFLFRLSGSCELLFFVILCINSLSCGCYFVVECYGIVECGGGALLDRPCMFFQGVCVLCL